MNKGITFYYGYKIDYKERVKLISEAGFDAVMTNPDDRFLAQNGTMEEQIELFKKFNLKPTSLHNQYKTPELPNFWLEGEIGDRLEKTLIGDILTAKKYGFRCVVVHMVGKYSKVGEERLLRVLKECEKNNVALAVENIDTQDPIIDIFKNVSHPYLKFCYDAGHNNCFDPEYDYLEKYGDKLVCLHLHDNNGKADEHTLNKFGTIDWDNIAKKFAKIKHIEDVSLDYELLMYGGQRVSADECLKETFKQAVELEQKILY